MALLKYKDISKMSPSERSEKMKELKMELIRASSPANKSASKNKEIKKAIARLITFSKSTKEELKKTKQ